VFVVVGIADAETMLGQTIGRSQAAHPHMLPIRSFCLCA
jgi:hypothetical protein